MVESHLLWKQLFPATNSPTLGLCAYACHGKACGPRAVLDFPPGPLPSPESLPSHPAVGTLSDRGFDVPSRRTGMKQVWSKAVGARGSHRLTLRLLELGPGGVTCLPAETVPVPPPSPQSPPCFSQPTRHPAFSLNSQHVALVACRPERPGVSAALQTLGTERGLLGSSRSRRGFAGVCEGVSVHPLVSHPPFV